MKLKELKQLVSPADSGKRVPGYKDLLSNNKMVIRKCIGDTTIILVNHKEGTIAVVPCDEQFSLSFRVPKNFEENKCRMRIYSTPFIKCLCRRYDLDEYSTYYLKGRYYEEGQAVIFTIPSPVLQSSLYMA